MKSFFAYNLLKARRHYGWVQQRAADAIGIKQKTYGAYEEGRADAPYDILFKICDVFCITDIRSFIFDENFDMNGKAVNDSTIEKQYSKLTGKDKIAVNALLEI